ncbi:hypothetical protein HDU79_011750 [Rhizoclosmatium sp. JEL0117]|nr:hypothetical protein HDU79_011750 [Rhizoclosmatium sp. JEL0117]
MHLLTTAIITAAAAAAACQPDVLVDDFRARTPDMYRQQPLVVNGVATGCETNTGFNGCNKTLNLLGGDFGDSYVAEVLSIGKLELTAGSDESSNWETASHPGTVATQNYWFTKFNWINDFDLTPYTGFAVDFIAPEGSDFNITLTQWLPATNTRGIDSQYRLLSSYVKPNGNPQTLLMKFADFAKNLNGDAFDMKHLKDVTFVNFGPLGTKFTFTKMTLIGDCGSSTTSGGASTTGSGAAATTTAKGSSAVGLTGVWALIAGILFA